MLSSPIIIRYYRCLSSSIVRNVPFSAASATGTATKITATATTRRFPCSCCCRCKTTTTTRRNTTSTSHDQNLPSPPHYYYSYYYRPQLSRFNSASSSSSRTRAPRFGIVGRDHPNNSTSSPPPRRRSFGTSSTADGVNGENSVQNSRPGGGSNSNDEKHNAVLHDLFMSYAHLPTKTNSNHEPEEPCLRVEDLHELLISTGVQEPSIQMVQNLLDEVDADHNGTIEFDEFLEGWDKILSCQRCHPHLNNDDDDDDFDRENTRYLVQMFRNIDRAGNGVITIDELEGLLSAAGPTGRIDHNDAKEILRLATGNGSSSSYIDLDSFIRFMTDDDPCDSTSLQYSWRLRSGLRCMMVMGGPGSGKTEFCHRLVDYAGGGNVHHLSSGDILRKEVASNSLLGQSIQLKLNSGSLVDNTTVIALLQKEIHKYPGSILALEGFPGTMQQYQDFTYICGVPECVIYIDVPEHVMMERMLMKQQQDELQTADSDIAHNTAANNARIDAFINETLPALEYIQDEDDVPVYEVDGTAGTTPDDVWAEFFLGYSDVPICRRILRRTCSHTGKIA